MKTNSRASCIASSAAALCVGARAYLSFYNMIVSSGAACRQVTAAPPPLRESFSTCPPGGGRRSHGVTDDL